MFGALLIHLAVIAAPPAAAAVAQPDCAHVHCSAMVDESAQAQKNCAGVHCAPVADRAPQSEARYGGESGDARADRAGLDANNHRYGDNGADRRFDRAHDASFDREGYDNSCTWRAQR
jgi:hypothetical protein